MEKNICIVHFNTPELTRAAIKSIWKNTPDARVTVFDNSDKRPFGEMEGVSVIDNTRGRVIDFEEFLSHYPERLPTANNWGSAKHTRTVDELFSLFSDGFLLLDPDTLVKRDLSDLFDESVAFIGELYQDMGDERRHVERVLPYLCWINVPLCRKYGIGYFDGLRSWKLTSGRSSDDLYDTGASFLEDCRKKSLPYREISISDYILHFKAASHSLRGRSWRAWLEKNKYLYEPMEKKNENEYLVVIPFFAGGAQGRELEYAVAGWRRHFKEPYRIVLVGDHHPVADTGDDITFIPCERVGPQPEYNYRPHIDFVKKFKAVRKAFPKSDGFIFVADDCYAVNDFDINDIKVLRQNGSKLNVGAQTKPWEREKKKTVELLQKEGYPIRNFTTHIPCWIEWDKLEALWEKYDMEHNSYIFEDLYFNIYYPTRIPLQLHIDYDNCKCGVYRPNPRMWYIEEAFKKKIWIQNSVEGWIPALDRMLAAYYGLDK